MIFLSSDVVHVWRNLFLCMCRSNLLSDAQKVADAVGLLISMVKKLEELFPSSHCGYVFRRNEDFVPHRDVN